MYNFGVIIQLKNLLMMKSWIFFIDNLVPFLPHDFNSVFSNTFVINTPKHPWYYSPCFILCIFPPIFTDPSKDWCWRVNRLGSNIRCLQLHPYLIEIAKSDRVELKEGSFVKSVQNAKRLKLWLSCLRLLPCWCWSGGSRCRRLWLLIIEV